MAKTPYLSFFPTDLLTIKTLMGHKSLDSTMIYVHLAVGSSSHALSPFDLMGGTV